MNLADLTELIRREYNAEGDDFFSDQEIRDYIYQAEMELAESSLVIEKRYTTSTVASQREYSFPTNTIAIKRVEYDGKKLQHISLREDDLVTLFNEDSTEEGEPSFYATWEEVIFLRPIPSEVKTMELYTYDEPARLTANTSSLNVPSRYHLKLKDFALSRMYAKDGNAQVAKNYENKWEKSKVDVRKMEKKKKRRDANTGVQSDEISGLTILGKV